MSQQYDVVVIGAGPGGYVAAIRAAQLGFKTVCIEKWIGKDGKPSLGGTCLNVGCIPSKALITAAKKYHGLQKYASMGIELSSEASINMGKLQEWKAGIVKNLTKGISSLLSGNKADKLLGEAKFLGGTTLEVTKSDGEVVRVECDNLVIATGSRPIEIPGYSYADERILDSTKALALDSGCFAYRFLISSYALM